MSPTPRWQVAVVWALVGEDGHVVRRTSHWWEVLDATREHRPAVPLYHAALQLRVDGELSVVEMTPRWGRTVAGLRDVVATGPVGSRWLGWSRLFRYEVRFIRPSVQTASEGVVLSEASTTVTAVVAAVPRVPRLTWGRRVRPTHDLWTSNSVVSWVLADAGLLGEVGPPVPGRAPGWEAGVAVRGGA